MSDVERVASLIAMQVVAAIGRVAASPRPLVQWIFLTREDRDESLRQRKRDDLDRRN